MIPFLLSLAVLSPQLVVHTSFDHDEIKVVNELIVATKERLSTQEHLRELMVQYEAQKEVFVQGDQTKTQTSRLLKLSREVYGIIQTEHLEHLFAKDYLDELQFFSSISGKKHVTRP